MSRSTKSPLRVATRIIVTAALGLTLAGVANAPAHALISKRFGSGFPTKATCDNVGMQEMSRQHSDTWTCYPQNGTWSGDLIWYT